MISRRALLRTLAAGALLAPGLARASADTARTLSLHNIHTGEELDVAYCDQGCYDPGALSEIDHLLRCHYTDEVKPIDLRVVDLLSEIQAQVGRGKRARIISGYRSPAYNEFLRRQGRGVVANSLHTRALAIDFAVPGVGTGELAKVARSHGVGGVGQYPDFVHIDAGRVRVW